MTSKWQIIKPDVMPDGITDIFVKHHFGSSEYQVQLTDLTNLWSESVGRRELIRRAWDVGTSIDPSEGPSQMQLLLEKIKASLLSQASSAISLTSESETHERLNLSTLTPLPGGLKPLAWPIYLSRCSQNCLTRSLILPCLAEMTLMNKQIHSLLKILIEKDNAIAKLIDKVHSDPVGLPVALLGFSKSKAGVASSLTDHALKSLKGLVPFDETQWRSQQSNSPVSGKNTSNFSSALELLSSDLSLSSMFDDSGGAGEGYHHRKMPAGGAVNRDRTPPGTPSPNAGFGEFGSQKTVNKAPGEQAEEGSSTQDTESDDSIGEVSTTSQLPSRPFRVGTQSNGRSDVTAAQHKGSGVSHQQNDSHKKVEIDDPIVPNDQHSPRSESGAENIVLEVAKLPKVKLGKIGGRKGPYQTPAALSNDQNQAPSDDVCDEGAATNDIEAVGLEQGKQKRARRETSRERADRKREQLRQDLQAGSNGSRKKRKF